MGDALEASSWERRFPGFEHLKEPVCQKLGTLKALLDCHGFASFEVRRGLLVLDVQQDTSACEAESCRRGFVRTRRCRMYAVSNSAKNEVSTLLTWIGCA